MPSIKRLTPIEAKANRKKGLCYSYDEKYSPSYCYKTKQLFLIEGKSDEEKEFPSKEKEEASEIFEEISSKILMHAISGSLSLETMQVKRMIKWQPITILIDSGSTHNFIDPTLSKKIQCCINKEKPFEVMVANGEKLATSDKCTNIPVSIQEF